MRYIYFIFLVLFLSFGHVQADTPPENGLIEFYNFKTNSKQHIADPLNISILEAFEYIPQIPEAQEIFKWFISQGHSNFESILYTYSVALDPNFSPTKDTK